MNAFFLHNAGVKCSPSWKRSEGGVIQGGLSTDNRVDLKNKNKNVEPKAPGQPGDLRPQGPRAGPIRSKQTLLRVRPARGYLHRRHRGQLRVHVMFWNAVSKIQHRSEI